MKRTMLPLAVLSALVTVFAVTACVPEKTALHEGQEPTGYVYHSAMGIREAREAAQASDYVYHSAYPIDAQRWVKLSNQYQEQMAHLQQTREALDELLILYQADDGTWVEVSPDTQRWAELTNRYQAQSDAASDTRAQMAQLMQDAEIKRR